MTDDERPDAGPIADIARVAGAHARQPAGLTDDEARSPSGCRLEHRHLLTHVARNADSHYCARGIAARWSTSTRAAQPSDPEPSTPALVRSDVGAASPTCGPASAAVDQGLRARPAGGGPEPRATSSGRTIVPGAPVVGGSRSRSPSSTSVGPRPHAITRLVRRLVGGRVAAHQRSGSERARPVRPARLPGRSTIAGRVGLAGRPPRARRPPRSAGARDPPAVTSGLNGLTAARQWGRPPP
jgi:hypothetical protein